MPKKHECVFRSNLETPADVMECPECGKEVHINELEKPKKRGEKYLISSDSDSGKAKPAKGDK